MKRIRDGAPTRSAETANILCRRHNSLLSPLDAVAGEIASFQARANDENFNETLYVEGELFERWLMKTVVNAAAAGWTMQRKLRPSPDIVAMIFGKAPIPHGCGFYSVDGVDPNLRPQGGVSFTPIVSKGAAEPLLGGAYVTVHGMPLFAAFAPDLAQRLEAGEAPSMLKRFSEEGLKHIYHPAAVVVSRKRGRPLIIGFSWNGLLRFQNGTTAPFPVKHLASAGP